MELWGFFYLQEVLELLASSPELPWGLYLQIESKKVLEASLELLASAYSSDELFRPVWVSVDGLVDAEEITVNSETCEIFITRDSIHFSWSFSKPGATAGLWSKVSSTSLSLHCSQSFKMTFLCNLSQKLNLMYKLIFKSYFKFCFYYIFANRVFPHKKIN